MCCTRPASSWGGKRREGNALADWTVGAVQGRLVSPAFCTDRVAAVPSKESSKLFGRVEDLIARSRLLGQPAHGGDDGGRPDHARAGENSRGPRPRVRKDDVICRRQPRVEVVVAQESLDERDPISPFGQTPKIDRVTQILRSRVPDRPYDHQLPWGTGFLECLHGSLVALLRMEKPCAEKERFGGRYPQSAPGLLPRLGIPHDDAFAMVNETRPNPNTIVTFEGAPLRVRMEEQRGPGEGTANNYMRRMPPDARLRFVNEDLGLGPASNQEEQSERCADPGDDRPDPRTVVDPWLEVDDDALELPASTRGNAEWTADVEGHTDVTPPVKRGYHRYVVALRSQALDLSFRVGPDPTGAWRVGRYDEDAQIDLRAPLPRAGPAERSTSHDGIVPDGVSTRLPPRMASRWRRRPYLAGSCDLQSGDS